MSLVVNPFPAWGKYRYGKRLDSLSLKHDAKDALVCRCQAVAVPIGLTLTNTVGWWWADPVAALAIAPCVAREGVEATRDAWRIGPDAAEDDAKAA